MKRHQIRRMIPGNVSDAQLRRAIAELGLPADDNHDYSAEEARQLCNQFRAPRPERHCTPAVGGDPSSNGRINHLAQSQASAQAAAETAKVALVTGQQERLVALAQALDKAEQRRSEVLERLSDRVAYLQDDALFMHDLLRLAQAKLQPQPAQQGVRATALDALVDAFDAVGDWELPAIAPATALGALPL